MIQELCRPSAGSSGSWTRATSAPRAGRPAPPAGSAPAAEARRARNREDGGSEAPPVDLPGAQQLEPLVEEDLELVDAAALQQHVPVGAGGLLRLVVLRLLLAAKSRDLAALGALLGLGDFGLGGHRNEQRKEQGTAKQQFLLWVEQAGVSPLHYRT